MASTRSTNKNGAAANYSHGAAGIPAEFSALGQDVGTANPYLQEPIEPNEDGLMLGGMPQFTQMINGSPTRFALLKLRKVSGGV